MAIWVDQRPSSSSSSSSSSRLEEENEEYAHDCALTLRIGPLSSMDDNNLIDVGRAKRSSSTPAASGDDHGGKARLESRLDYEVDDDEIVDDQVGEVLHPEGQYWIPTPAQILEGLTFSCPECSKTFKHVHILQVHLWEHGIMERPMPQVGMLPSVLMTLPCYCCVPGCRKNIENKQAKPLKDFATLKSHYKRTHDTKTFKCPKCFLKFTKRSVWRAHEKVCGQMLFCTCGSTFTFKRSLEKHVRNRGAGHALWDDSRRVPPSPVSD
ncbi:unnamed protein product [Calypogeia fissa]